MLVIGLSHTVFQLGLVFECEFKIRRHIVDEILKSDPKVVPEALFKRE